MARKNKYELPGLEQDLDLIYKNIEALTGKTVPELPQITTVANGSMYDIKQDDGTFKTYKKINNVFMIMKTDGTNIYWEEL